MKTLIIFAVCVGVCQEIVGQQVYYPLQVGKVWEYSGLGTWSKVSVIRDTVMVNGKQYALISRGLYDSDFQRQEGNNVYRFNGAGEELLFDFSKLPGDTVASYPAGSDTTDIFLECRDSIDMFGTIRRHWIFLIRLTRQPRLLTGRSLASYGHLF